MKRMHKLGIIGFGGIGKFLYQAWSTLDTVELVAVADLNNQEFELNLLKGKKLCS